MSLAPNTVVKRSQNQVETQIDGETLMMSLERAKYFAVKETSQRIWELLEEPTSVKSVVSQLVLEYDVAEDTCEREVLALLAELQSEGLLLVDG